MDAWQLAGEKFELGTTEMEAWQTRNGINRENKPKLANYISNKVWNIQTFESALFIL